MRTAERQRQYRLDVAEERERMKSALEEIVAELEGKEKELSVRLRAIALKGLGRLSE
jgi:hypothetical protein